MTLPFAAEHHGSDVGSAEKLGQDLADRIRERAEPFMMQPNPELSFDVAALGDDSGVVGTASIGQAKVLR